MKGSVIALDIWNGAKAAALIVDGRLEDVLINPPALAGPRPGTVFQAIVDRLVKGMGGAFVRLPEGGTGFLRNIDGLRPGQAILVQVTGFAEPGKATPVTVKLRLKGRYVILTPGAPGVNVSRKIREEASRTRLRDAVLGFDLGESGAILRSQSATAPPDAVIQEVTDLLALSTEISARNMSNAPAVLSGGPDSYELASQVWPEVDFRDDKPSSFARHGVDDMLVAMAHSQISLAGGTSAWIEPTRALVAVDVNTGGDTTPAAGLKANIALARDLPRQLRCRGLGGQITLDLAPMLKRDRKQVEQALKSAFRTDSIETACVGWTPLGHYELQRKRERFPNFSA